MHIESYSIGNNTYLRLAESIVVANPDGKPSVKKRILLNLGNMKKFDDGQPDFLKRLRSSFAAGTPLVPELLPYVQERASSPPEELYLDPRNLGYLFLEALFDALEASSVLTRHKSRRKVPYDLLGLSKLLVFGRMLLPESKIRTFGQRSQYTFPVTEEEDFHTIYHCLDELAQARNALVQRFNTVLNRNGQRRTELTYYDVTNYYFEIDRSDPDELDAEGNLLQKGLRKDGVSKENRKQPIVQMGLLIDREGLPITFDLYPGNTLDHSTFQPCLERLKKELQPERIVVVADRGIINFRNILALQDNGYVMSKSLRKATKEEKAWAIDPEGFRGGPEEDFRVKSRIISRRVKNDEGQYVTLQQKQVVYWSRKFYERELKENETFLKMLEEFIEDPNRFPIQRYKGLSRFIGTRQIDRETGELLDTKELQYVKEEKVREYTRYFGYYMIATSELDKTDEEIIDIYRGLTRIENCFRTVKSDFQARPVYVRTRNHIGAHFTVCFMALLMMRLLQRQILRYKGLPTTHTFDWEEGLSSSRIQAALKGMQTSLESDGGYRLTRPDGDLKLLLNALGLKHPGAKCSYSELVQFKNVLKKRMKEIL